MDRTESTAPLRSHIGELSKEIPQVQDYQQFLSNTENKYRLLKKFTEYLTQENTRKDLMGRTTFTIEKDTVLTSKSEQQSIFTPNQE